jgi:hypothetical protein
MKTSSPIICILAEQGDTKCEIDGVYFIMLYLFLAGAVKLNKQAADIDTFCQNTGNDEIFFRVDVNLVG